MMGKGKIWAITFDGSCIISMRNNNCEGKIVETRRIESLNSNSAGKQVSWRFIFFFIGWASFQGDHYLGNVGNNEEVKTLLAVCFLRYAVKEIQEFIG